jgi:hypothetical protein
VIDDRRQIWAIPLQARAAKPWLVLAPLDVEGVIKVAE